MSNMSVNFHWRDRAIGDQAATTSTIRKEREHIVVSFGEAPEADAIRLFFASAAAAYSFASTIMSGAEYLEGLEQAAKDDPERPWVDVPLPLDDESAAGDVRIVQSSPSVETAIYVSSADGELAGRVPGDRKLEDVALGLVEAVETARAARARAAAAVAASSGQDSPPPLAPAPDDFSTAVCMHGTAVECAKVGCPDERCPRF